MHCQCGSDTAEHTIFHCPNWDGLRDELRTHLGHPPEAIDGESVLCGPLFEDLQRRPPEMVLSEVEETFRIFYKTSTQGNRRKGSPGARRCGQLITERDSRAVGLGQLKKRYGDEKSRMAGLTGSRRLRTLNIKQIII